MGGSAGCIVGGNTVCAGAGETEHVSLARGILANDANFDNAIAASFPGIVTDELVAGAMIVMP